MHLYLASAALPDIEWATKVGLADGVVATPAVIAAEFPQADPREVVAELVQALTVPVCASVAAVSASDIYKGGRDLAKLGDNVVVAVPFVEDALPAIRRLSTDGVRVAATLVFSAAQGMLAAKAGAAMVSVAVDALAAVGDDGSRVIAELRAAFDRAASECDVIAAGPADAAAFTRCAVAGADVAVVAPAGLRALLQHPLTDRGLDRFLGEISRRPKPRRAR